MGINLNTSGVISPNMRNNLNIYEVISLNMRSNLNTHEVIRLNRTAIKTGLASTTLSNKYLMAYNEVEPMQVDKIEKVSEERNCYKCGKRTPCC